MILKSLSRRSGIWQLLDYLFEKEGQQEKQLVIKHNMRARSIEGWTKELEANNALRIHKRRDNIVIQHTVLSLSNKDIKHASPEMLKDLAKKFIELRGKENMYIGTIHTEKDHLHIHLIMSPVAYMTGESNRISREKLHEIKVQLDAYQREQYPQLIHSLPRHGRAKEAARMLQEQEYQQQQRTGRLSQKQEVIQLLDATYQQADSLDDFLHKLQEQGHVPYYRNGKLTGIQYKGSGRKFRFKRLGHELTSFKEKKLLQALQQARTLPTRERRR